jgi:small-conductance mechanosensitive channel
MNIVERLRSTAAAAEKWDGPTLTNWDSIRRQVETMPGSDIPRMNFENLIEELTGPMREAADEIERLRADTNVVHADLCAELDNANAEIERLREERDEARRLLLKSKIEKLT